MLFYNCLFNLPLLKGFESIARISIRKLTLHNFRSAYVIFRHAVYVDVVDFGVLFK